MQINELTRDLAIEAIWAAVSQDPSRCAAALEAMHGRGLIRECMALGMVIGALALEELVEDPDPEDIDELSGTFVEVEDWALFDRDDVRNYLTGLAYPEEEGLTVAPEVLVRLVFVMDAYLIAAFTQGGERWYERLRGMLETIGRS